MIDKYKIKPCIRVSETSAEAEVFDDPRTEILSIRSVSVTYQGQFIVSQIMDHAPWKIFHRCLQRYQGDRNVRTFTCSQQYRAMAIGTVQRRSFNLALRLSNSLLNSFINSRSSNAKNFLQLNTRMDLSREFHRSLVHDSNLQNKLRYNQRPRQQRVWRYPNRICENVG